MSFIAALMSMQPDLGQLQDTLQIWAAAALPSGVVIMVLIFVVSMPQFKTMVKLLYVILRQFPWFGQRRPFLPGA
jgi:hypothetical protein